MTDPRTAVHLLGRLDAEPCVQPACEGRLERRRYKGTRAVVCTDCEIDYIRI